MPLLLDTHTLVWMYSARRRLSSRVEALLADHAADSWVSDLSLWELAIKIPLGKLSLGVSLAEVEQRIDDSEVRWLPIRRSHLMAVSDLPLHHRDPFDRLLVAQCLTEELTLLSANPAFDNYGVKRIW